MAHARAASKRTAVYGRAAELKTALAALVDASNLLIVGAKGMGKTLFLSELLMQPALKRRRIIHIKGSRVMTGERYGAMRNAAVSTPAGAADLPDPDDFIANPALLSPTLRPGAPVIIAVDDAHLLDEFSLDWLSRVSAAELANVVLTSQPISSATVTDAGARQQLTDLWSSWGGARVDLGPIDQRAAEALVASLIGAESCAAGWGAHFFRRSGGSPQLLRELAAEGIRSNAFTTSPPIQPSPLAPASGSRLSELLRPRLERLSTARLSELVVLSSLGPLDTEHARELLSWQGVTELIDHGFAVRDSATGLLTVSEVVAACAVELTDRDDLTLTSARATQRLVAEFDGSFHRLSFVQLRFIAQSMLRPPAHVDPVELISADARRRLLLRAARASTRAGQPELAVECSLRLLQAGPDFAASAELAKAYLAQHQHDAADRVLSGLEPPTSLARGRIVLRLRQLLLLWHLGDDERLDAFLTDALDWFELPGWRAEVITAMLVSALLRLDAAASRELAERVFCDPDASDLARVVAASLASTTIALCGDVDEGERMRELHQVDSWRHGDAGFTVLGSRVLISLFTSASRPAIGNELYATGISALQHSDVDRLLAVSWLSGQVVMQWGGDDDLVAAMSMIRYATRASAEGMRAFLGTEYVRALARRGALDHAAVQLAQVDQLAWLGPTTLFAYLRERAHIELLRAHGEHEHAGAIAAEAARTFGGVSPLLAGRLLEEAPTRDARTAIAPIRDRDAWSSQLVGLPLDGPFSTLSEREREIVELAARGMSNAEVARRLFLSVRTVESHLYHARVKLGVTGRDGIARLGAGDELIGKASA